MESYFCSRTAVCLLLGRRKGSGRSHWRRLQWRSACTAMEIDGDSAMGDTRPVGLLAAEEGVTLALTGEEGEGIACISDSTASAIVQTFLTNLSTF